MKRRRPKDDEDPLWYKDAIIYEVHPRGFRDSNRDGIGDFRGLTQKLDYIQDLGVTCIWLLPFYPSPLRDDGYDISNYRGVLPEYGTLADFKQFLDAAHDRNLRVMTELVVDHTSDQHPWFQAARLAPHGSSRRNWYVWSKNGSEYKDARIIFTDTETSNWHWDSGAKAYYWHRFFHHQPNLNFAHAPVRRAIQKVMEFWLDLGVDGMRLDAIPYLYQREGTNCENLPEIHNFLKDLRTHLDRNYRNRIFLAEANQWPTDVLPYFGQGDECHMAYHFPLMPRLYMALAQESRLPIIDILRSTPAIPDVCQWAMFLRNHDELTLEMVTHEERDYMYREYAKDPRMKLNVGIRRRLAPLLDYDRKSIELLNNLLLTMPGTPVIYYGDEIGMGDNIYLRDRDGVRTPMQWSMDRNAGFSESDAARLYAPVLVDSLGGYPAVTVEAQQSSASSLLRWMRHLIAQRRRFQAFGRGGIQFLEPENQKVLAFVRNYRDETILVVSNLSRQIQPVSLDLSAYRGRIPVELLGRAHFPAIRNDPYFLSLAPRGFLWFSLEQPEPLGEVAAAQSPHAEAVLFAGSLDGVLADTDLRRVEVTLLQTFIQKSRWFARFNTPLSAVRIVERIALPASLPRRWFTLALVRFPERPPETFYLPLVLERTDTDDLKNADSVERRIGTISAGNDRAHLELGFWDPATAQALATLIHHETTLTGQDGTVHGRRTEWSKTTESGSPLSDAAVTHLPPGEDSVELALGGRFRLSLYHHMREGEHPTLEMARHLTDSASCPVATPLHGWLEYRRRDGATGLLGLLWELPPNRGDAWTYFHEHVGLFYENFQLDPRDPSAANFTKQIEHLAGILPEYAGRVGQCLARLHLSLASDATSFAFFPEPLIASWRTAWAERMIETADRVLKIVKRDPQNTPERRDMVNRILSGKANGYALFRRIRKLPLTLSCIRIHGNFNLAQLVLTHNMFRINGFDTPSDTGLLKYRTKDLALRDVASLFVSLHESAFVAIDRATQGFERDRILAHVVCWRLIRLLGRRLLEAYAAELSNREDFVQDQEDYERALTALVLERALTELERNWTRRPERAQAQLQLVDEIVNGGPAVLSLGTRVQ